MNSIEINVRQQWDVLKKDNPHLRIRNAATQLGVSEAALLVTQIGETVTRLRPEFAAILSEIETLGKVMALTRNDECVHERKGVYLNPDFSNAFAGLFVGEDIDLRIFLHAWESAFAVVEPSGDTVKRSLQFFGKDGMAIHKIFLTPDSHVDAFDVLVEKYISEDQEPTQAFIQIPAIAEEKPDADIAITAFQESWINLKDTHDFFGMLKKYGVSRTQALRLAPNDYFAKTIDKQSIVSLLEKAASEKLPIMVFVGNRGNIQIHTGTVRKTMWHGSWFNVMDPDFNLHLDMDKIAQTWIVRKPTEDGVVTAVEVFNDKGEIIVQFFGKRKPGIPELEAWRSLVADLV